MALETDYSVPAVAVHADAFARLVDSVLRVNGMPRASFRRTSRARTRCGVVPS
jgi:hypothetical protein